MFHLHRARSVWSVAGLLGVFLVVTGCHSSGGLKETPPPKIGTDVSSTVEKPFLTVRELVSIAEEVKATRQANTPPQRVYHMLAISGGGNYGAYCAGVLCGWTKTGTRPTFDTVTGISTGALIATLAFMGPEYDCELTRVYTTLHSKDIFKMKPPLRAALFSDSLAENKPLAQQIEKVITDDFLRQLAQEHAAGRRLYVGTTNIETKRLIVWDMGAIASRGTPESAQLFRKLLLASAAIPGFFPPVRIPVEIDGQQEEELHVDGGASAAVFIRPPPCPPGQDRHTSLAGSKVYVLVAGKLYADPDHVKPKALTIAGNSISSLIYSQTRSELQAIYTGSALAGADFAMTAIPDDFPAPRSSTEFEPEVMTKMFIEGYRLALDGSAWRHTPPGAENGEYPRARTGTLLTTNANHAGILLPEPTIYIPWFGPLRTPEGIPVPTPPSGK